MTAARRPTTPKPAPRPAASRERADRFKRADTAPTPRDAYAPAAPSAPANSIAPVSTITPISIEAGSDTGTAVSKSVATMRNQISSLETSLAQNAQRLADLRNAGADAASAYHEAKAHITTRLQVGTTRGNPELVSEWNTAQTSLDQWRAISTGSTPLAPPSRAIPLRRITRWTRLQPPSTCPAPWTKIIASFRCLKTNQPNHCADRPAFEEVSDDVQRQTAYVANERSDLTVLASSIKNGELYGGELGGS